MIDAIIKEFLILEVVSFLSREKLSKPETAEYMDMIITRSNETILNNPWDLFFII